MRSVLLAVALAFALASRSVAAETHPGAAVYLELCSACHTIGEGDGAGPDLLPATKKAPQELRAAIVRMETNVGPMRPEQIDSLVDLLKTPNVQQILTGGAAPAAPNEKPLPAGSALEGRRLFFGEARLQNGGSPCFACHSVGGRGGNLAADLTSVRTRIGSTGLTTLAERPTFPMMKAAYATHPVTQQEAIHLAAFFTAPTATNGPAPGGQSVLHSAAAGAVVAFLGAVALLFRARREGVRSRVVRRASGGKS
jgi:ubiquinol-cytochrome c reductase cytochrome c subunit